MALSGALWHPDSLSTGGAGEHRQTVSTSSPTALCGHLEHPDSLSASGAGLASGEHGQTVSTSCPTALSGHSKHSNSLPAYREDLVHRQTVSDSSSSDFSDDLGQSDNISPSLC
jgi:hypothetical protein